MDPSKRAALFSGKKFVELEYHLAESVLGKWEVGFQLNLKCSLLSALICFREKVDWTFGAFGAALW